MKYWAIEELQKRSFFQSLPTNVIQTLLNMGRCCEYQKKEMVYRAGEVSQVIHILLEGQVMIYNLTKHGNRKVIFVLGGGHLLDHNMVNPRPSSVFCEAAGRAEVLLVPRAEFARLAEQNLTLTQAVLQEYERYIWRLSHQLKNTTGNMHTERKIAAKLWKLGRDFGAAGEDGVCIELDMTITLLADLVGVPRETISRACKTLAEKGLLIYRDRRFILPDPDALAQFYKM